jgi:integrase
MFKAKIEPASPTAIAALTLIALTGWRESEVLTLKWADINLATGFATLAETKSGKSIRALGRPAIELLSSQSRVVDSPYVFPGGSDPMKALEGVRRLWHSVRHAANLTDVRLHDLRHSVASFAAGQKYTLHEIAGMLGHKSTRSTERYAHLADDSRRLMADAVSTTIHQAMSSAPRKIASAKRPGRASRLRLA